MPAARLDQGLHNRPRARRGHRRHKASRRTRDRGCHLRRTVRLVGALGLSRALWHRQWRLPPDIGRQHRPCQRLHLPRVLNGHSRMSPSRAHWHALRGPPTPGAPHTAPALENRGSSGRGGATPAEDQLAHKKSHAELHYGSSREGPAFHQRVCWCSSKSKVPGPGHL